MLGQNTSIQRNVSEAFIEDVQNNVLQRYALLSFTYQLRNFGQAPPAQERNWRER